MMASVVTRYQESGLPVDVDRRFDDPIEPPPFLAGGICSSDIQVKLSLERHGRRRGRVIMYDMRFRNWVFAEYGPFPDTDALDDFTYVRGDELQEAFDEWCRLNDDNGEPVGV